MAVISSSEQSLNFIEGLFYDVNGTYGCLVDDLVYTETTVQLNYTPELKSSLGHGLNTVPMGSNLTLTCSVRSHKEAIKVNYSK